MAKYSCPVLEAHADRVSRSAQYPLRHRGYFADFWSNSRYLARLWEHQLPCCLLWFIPHSDTAPGLPKYRPPFWSWAAIDGSVVSSTGGNTLQTCAVVHCHAVPKRDVNVYGEVVSGFLDLDVIVRLVIWDLIDAEMFEAAGGPEGIPDDSRSEQEGNPAMWNAMQSKKLPVPKARFTPL